MTDYDAVIVNTNLGALDAIIEAGKSRPDAIIGVTPGFRNDFDLLVKTARWLIGKQDAKYKPKRMLPDLESFKNWNEVKDEYALHGSPSIGKYLSILSKAQGAAGEESTDKDTIFGALDYLERLTGRLRIQADGFVVPQNIGSAGKLGNALKYRIEGGQLIIENDSHRSSYSLRPYQGTTNNKGILNLNGFRVPRTEPGSAGPDRGKLREIESELLREKSREILDKPRIKELEKALEEETKRGSKSFGGSGRFYGYVAPLEGDGRQQLEELVRDLSGESIDVEVITVHRGKGLEYDNVRIWNDFPKPDSSSSELEAIARDTIVDAAGKTAEDRNQRVAGMKDAWNSDAELNKYYTAFTRAAKVLDPGGLDWIFDYSKGKYGNATPKTAVSPERRQVLDKQKTEADKRVSASDQATGKLGKGVEYEVSGDNIIVSGKTQPIEGILKGMGFVFRKDGNVWFLRIGKSADAAEALGKRMKAIEALKKRIDLL
jgi:hypothetical protein